MSCSLIMLLDKFLRLGLLVTLLFLLVRCDNQIKSYQPEGLRKLTHQEYLERARARQTVNPEMVTYKNDHGDVIPRDSLHNYRDGFFGDQYVNDEGKTVEIVLRPLNEDDKKRLVELRDAWYESEEIMIGGVEIECKKADSILQAVYVLDQEMRSHGNSIDQNVDYNNLEIVINLIKQCGMPTLQKVNQRAMDAVWLVFQHSIYNKYRKEYLPLLKKSAQNGDLDQGNIAMMEDRILMNEYKPQVYGTQVIKNDGDDKWKLYNLSDPEFVDQRRAEVGLGPLKDYLSRWDIEFEVAQKN